jgi:hypothetical protein
MLRRSHPHSEIEPYPGGEPLLLLIAGYQVLAYEAPDGIRVSSWKHPEHIEGGAAVVYDVEDPGEEIRSQVFSTIRELEIAVLRNLFSRRSRNN